MALAVLLYHFFTWTIGTPDSASVLGRLGIYAVSTFYIVSGMSMFVAYQRSTWSPREILFFVTKRYLRLAPAFWLACTMVVVFLAYTSPTFVIPPEKYIGNYTLTFGFTAPNQYLTVGGWSIGNEMVFYAFFPLVMMIPKIRPALVVSSLAVTLYFYIHYSFFKLTPTDYLGNQWNSYIDPRNQAFLFFLGVAIAWASLKFSLQGSNYTNIILAISLLTFTIYPANGNQIQIVSGIERIIFTAACGGLCFAVFNTRYKVRPTIQKALFMSGCLSYAIYMFHGIFADITIHILCPAVGVTTPGGKLAMLLLVTTPVIMIFTYFFYAYIEKPVMNLGRHLKSRKFLPSEAH